MKGKRFTEEQIIGVLREAEAGAKTKELCRRHGISEATFSKLPEPTSAITNDRPMQQRG